LHSTLRLREEAIRAVGRSICPLTGKRLKSWIIVKPNNALRERIRTWARQQQLDLDALEIAATKIRKLKQVQSRHPPKTASYPDLTVHTLADNK
jgi:hypothetical protein